MRWSVSLISLRILHSLLWSTVKGFHIVNEAEVDLSVCVFLEFPCFLYDPANFGNLITGSSAFSKSSWNFCKFMEAAANAKSLQSCPTLCDPMDGSPPGSPIPGILQARTLEWVAISSPMHESEKWKWGRSVVSDPQRPHGLQPSRLLSPWDFPGKRTGVGCQLMFKYCFYTWLPFWLLKSEYFQCVDYARDHHIIHNWS